MKNACEVEWHGFLLLRESAGSASSQLLRQARRLRLQQLSLGHKIQPHTGLKISPTLMLKQFAASFIPKFVAILLNAILIFLWNQVCRNRNL